MPVDYIIHWHHYLFPSRRAHSLHLSHSWWFKQLSWFFSEFFDVPSLPFFKLVGWLAGWLPACLLDCLPLFNDAPTQTRALNLFPLVPSHLFFSLPIFCVFSFSPLLNIYSYGLTFHSAHLVYFVSSLVVVHFWSSFFVAHTQHRTTWHTEELHVPFQATRFFCFPPRFSVVWKTCKNDTRRFIESSEREIVCAPYAFVYIDGIKLCLINRLESSRVYDGITSIESCLAIVFKSLILKMPNVGTTDASHR